MLDDMALTRKILERRLIMETLGARRAEEVAADIDRWNMEHPAPEEEFFEGGDMVLDPDEEVARIEAWEKETQRLRLNPESLIREIKKALGKE